MHRLDFSYLQNSGRLFLTLRVIASSTQFFAILKNFDIKKNNRKTWHKSKFQSVNEDYRLPFCYVFFHKFSSKFEFFLIFIKIAHNFVTSPVASFIAIVCKVFNQILWLLENHLNNSSENNFLPFFGIFWLIIKYDF